MLESSDKRDFHRMTVNCSARFRVVGDEKVTTAQVRDLSGSGMLLLSDSPVEAGVQLHVAILPEKEITPPLYAVVQVIRCDPLEGDEGAFALACNTIDMLDIEKLGEEFP
ncbi:MAG: PilZ domain-containing protein [Candidatus Sedimenticola sp. (ex Thyasira tokunagai)]